MIVHRGYEAVARLVLGRFRCAKFVKPPEDTILSVPPDEEIPWRIVSVIQTPPLKIGEKDSPTVHAVRRLIIRGVPVKWVIENYTGLIVIRAPVDAKSLPPRKDAVAPSGRTAGAMTRIDCAGRRHPAMINASGATRGDRRWTSFNGFCS